MPHARILGTGHFVPPRVVTNHELAKLMDTSHEWIVERTGIEERRWVDEGTSGADMAEHASRQALEMAGLAPTDIDLIVFATLSPDLFFPGTGVLLQRQLGLSGNAVLDIRQQCTGFIYGTAIADAFIRAGMARHVLLVGCEIHSTGLDLTTRGRDVTVIFGDGAGAVVFGPTDDPNRGVLATTLHADGKHAELLMTETPSSKRHPRVSEQDLAEGRQYPSMQGRQVFKYAAVRMPDAVKTVCEKAGVTFADLDLVITHQANLRISETARQFLGMPPEKFYNNIQKYGNTTAASIPIALDECMRSGRLKEGNLLALTAFGAGFTWGGALIRI